MHLAPPVSRALWLFLLLLVACLLRAAYRFLAHALLDIPACLPHSLRQRTGFEVRLLLRFELGTGQGGARFFLQAGAARLLCDRLARRILAWGRAGRPLRRGGSVPRLQCEPEREAPWQ